jgi:DNA/RNA-binding domain of Phe-tRNA-synthetase-like protein
MGNMQRVEILIDSACKAAGVDSALFAVIRGVSVKESSPAMIASMAAAQGDIATNLDIILTQPESAGYQDIMASIGFPATTHAGAKLAKLVARRGLRPISNVVDAYNLAAARRALPIGAHDIDTIAWPLRLHLAGDGLLIKTFGSEVPVVVRPGSIVYTDEGGATVACIGKNDVDCVNHAVTPATRSVLLTLILHKRFSEDRARDTLRGIFRDMQADMPDIQMDLVTPVWVTEH